MSTQAASVNQPGPRRDAGEVTLAGAGAGTEVGPGAGAGAGPVATDREALVETAEVPAV